MTNEFFLMMFISLIVSGIVRGTTNHSEKKSHITDYGCREDFSSRGKEDEY